MNTWRALSRLGLVCGLLLGLWSVRPAESQQILSGELAVGSWYGRAVPVNPATAPFPEVIMTPTFFADGTLIANDSHEDTNPHATSHGHWIRTTSNRVEATFIWINLTDKAPNGFAGAMKVRLNGQIDPARPDEMKGNVTPVLFPPGTDPMDPKDAGGIPLGTFVIAELRRIKTDAKNVGDPNLNNELAAGSWYGRAIPDNPATAPFPEVIMSPTFFGDGNLVANDSHEVTNSHTTSHGNWVRTGVNRVEATFIWINLTDKAPNGFAGTFKVRITGAVDPAKPDQMTGKVVPVLFPPGTDPLDPKDTGGQPLGIFTIAELRRIKTDAKNVGDPSLSGEYATGSWYGRAIPDNPATAPFPEVIMSPTFFGDGNLIANDSHEVTNPHTSSHGNWVRTGVNRVEATFIWINLTDKAPNGFAGTFKVRIIGAVDPSDPNRMTGKVVPVLFPPGTDPLDPKDTGGQSLGTFTIAELRRVETKAVTPPVVQAGSKNRATILATVTQNGAPARALNLSFSLAVSGRRMDYKWKGTTDANGLARVEIAMDPGQFWQTGASNYYRARATSATGDVIGEWGSIPINGGKETTLSLPVGGSARIDAEKTIQAAPALTLGGNFPNPFNPATQITYRLQTAGEISLKVYSLIGQEVRTLVRGPQQAGDYRVTWDGRDNVGRPVTSGVYFYTLASVGFSQTGQMMLLK